jgi:hypothetical protein
MCAGPYGHRLMGISEEESIALEAELLEKNELLRPGFARIALAMYWQTHTLDFVTRAVEFVATHGHLFVPSYVFYAETGEWRHRNIGNKSPFRRWIHDIKYVAGRMTYKTHEALLADAQGEEDIVDPARMLEAAHAYAAEYKAHYSHPSIKIPNDTPVVSEQVLKLGLRWFVLPSDVIGDLTGKKPSPPLEAASASAPGHVVLAPCFTSITEQDGDRAAAACILAPPTKRAREDTAVGAVQVGESVGAVNAAEAEVAVFVCPLRPPACGPSGISGLEEDDRPSALVQSHEV